MSVTAFIPMQPGDVKDLSCFANIVAAGGDRQIRLGFDPSGEVVTGIAQLAQWVAAFFMTEKGSDPYDQEYGTEFITAMRFGYIRSDPDVVAYFSLATSDIFRYFRNMRASATGTARLASVQLLSYQLTGDKLMLQVKVVSSAGEAVEVVIPAKVI